MNSSVKGGHLQGVRNKKSKSPDSARWIFGRYLTAEHPSI